MANLKIDFVSGFPLESQPSVLFPTLYSLGFLGPSEYLHKGLGELQKE